MAEEAVHVMCYLCARSMLHICNNCRQPVCSDHWASTECVSCAQPSDQWRCVLCGGMYKSKDILVGLASHPDFKFNIKMEIAVKGHWIFEKAFTCFECLKHVVFGTGVELHSSKVQEDK